MFCPFCNAEETKVVDSRLVGNGNQVRRRRECIACHERYTTYEVAELVMPRIIKSDGRRSPFDEEKLRNGLLKALEKRPVSMEDVEAALSRIMYKLRATGEREVSSMFLGEQVMNELLELDKVAFVRFASVYHRFQNIDAFRKLIQELETGLHNKSN